MPAKVILIVEDEKAIRDMIAFGLRRAGFEIREAQDCRAARTDIAARRPDLLLVDWMLPDMTGLEFTRQLKRDPNLKELPIIMLTARAEEADKVAGLEGGADDYVTKPFSTRELMARIQAVLRRVDPAVGGEIVDIEGLRLDPVAHRVTAGDKAVVLGPTRGSLGVVSAPLVRKSGSANCTTPLSWFRASTARSMLRSPSLGTSTE
jgi:two-component system phosphate regulon response regulator PhoB